MKTAPAPVTTPTNGGLIVRETIRLEPGVYYLPEGITIAAPGVTLDGCGATIIGDNRRGTGVTIDGLAGVTIRNLRIRDYQHGIRATRADNVTIEQNHITSTAEVEPNTIFLDIWRPATEAYGAAILLDRVNGAEINDNDIQHQQNGLLTYHCTKLNVRRNIANYSSGFGFHLFGTCDSVFEENWADYCCRYEPRDKGGIVVGANSVGHMGADTTGFLIVQAACRNVFRKNFARLGGDGFFLAGRNPAGDDVGSNDNLFEENDGSLSPNIAFEATFSSGNIFRNNWADRCNFGFWLGYSSKNILEGNRMLYNRQAGIAVEHGVGFEVRRNDFQSNGHGVLLWTKRVKAFFDDPANNRTTRDWVIEHNRFFRNDYAIAIRADRDHGIRPVPETDRGLEELRPRDIAIRHNDIQDNRVGVQLLNTDRVTVEKNKLNKNVEADIRCEDDRETVIGHNLGQRGAYL